MSVKDNKSESNTCGIAVARRAYHFTTMEQMNMSLTVRCNWSKPVRLPSEKGALKGLVAGLGWPSVVEHGSAPNRRRNLSLIR